MLLKQTNPAVFYPTLRGIHPTISRYNVTPPELYGDTPPTIDRPYVIGVPALSGEFGDKDGSKPIYSMLRQWAARTDNPSLLFSFKVGKGHQTFDEQNYCLKLLKDHPSISIMPNFDDGRYQMMWQKEHGRNYPQMAAGKKGLAMWIECLATIAIEVLVEMDPKFECLKRLNTLSVAELEVLEDDLIQATTEDSFLDAFQAKYIAFLSPDSFEAVLNSKILMYQDADYRGFQANDFLELIRALATGKKMIVWAEENRLEGPLGEMDYFGRGTRNVAIPSLRAHKASVQQLLSETDSWLMEHQLNRKPLIGATKYLDLHLSRGYTLTGIIAATIVGWGQMRYANNWGIEMLLPETAYEVMMDYFGADQAAVKFREYTAQRPILIDKQDTHRGLGGVSTDKQGGLIKQSYQVISMGHTNMAQIVRRHLGSISNTAGASMITPDASYIFGPAYQGLFKQNYRVEAELASASYRQDREFNPLLFSDQQSTADDDQALINAMLDFDFDPTTVGETILPPPRSTPAHISLKLMKAVVQDNLDVARRIAA